MIPQRAFAAATVGLLGVLALIRRGLVQRARGAVRLLRDGHAGIVWHAMRRRVFDRSRSIGLERDLSVPFPVPSTAMPVGVRPHRAGDRLAFLDAAPDLSERSAWNRTVQRRLLASKLPGCWVGVDAGGTPCYMQWLITAQDAKRIRRLWGGLFPRLGADEALVEGIFTAEEYRRRGIMAHAMARIADEARATGIRRVLVFVSERNAASLNGCLKAGFVPYVERWETRVLFRRFVRFKPVRSDPPYSRRISSP